MTEYIEREALIKAIDNNFAKLDIDVCNPPYYDGANDEYADIRLIIQKQPVADVQPAKHGRWEYEDTIGGMKHYHCTNCDSGNECIADENQILWWEFCPKCGARMDGDENA